MEFFSLLFDNDIVDEIIKYTNLHVEKLKASLKDRKKGADFIKNSKKWKLPEFCKFVGLAFLMGNLGFPEHRLYWSETSLYHHPIFSKTMSRNSFQFILRALCCYDVTQKHQNICDKVSWFISTVPHNFQKYYSPPKELSEDEALLLFKGCLGFKQKLFCYSKAI